MNLWYFSHPMKCQKKILYCVTPGAVYCFVTSPPPPTLCLTAFEKGWQLSLGTKNTQQQKNFSSSAFFTPPVFSGCLKQAFKLKRGNFSNPWLSCSSRPHCILHSLSLCLSINRHTQTRAGAFANWSVEHSLHVSKFKSFVTICAPKASFNYFAIFHSLFVFATYL